MLVTVEWRQPAGFGFSRKYPILDPNRLQLAQSITMGLVKSGWGPPELDPSVSSLYLQINNETHFVFFFFFSWPKNALIFQTCVPNLELHDF